MADRSRLREGIEELCRTGEGPGLQIILEQLLAVLEDERPSDARVAALALRTQGGSLKRMADDLLARLPDEPNTIKPISRVHVDYLILTIKPVERRAFLRAVGGEQHRADVGHGREIVLCESNGMRFGVAHSGIAGNVTTAVLIGSMIPVIECKGAALVGTAGGVSGKTRVGDVVVSETVIDYEFQRMAKDGPRYMPRARGPREAVYSQAEILIDEQPGWAQDVAEKLRRLNFGLRADEIDDSSRLKFASYEPAVKLGAILAGAKLLEDGSLPKMSRVLSDRARAAEMEGAGFAAVCEAWDKPWVVVRGVADVGEEDRDKLWQFTASYAAARCLIDGLAQRTITLDPERLS